MTQQAEVIVVGAGINGLWTAYTSCKSGKNTILLEQFPMPHSRGSSHGQSRIIRYGYVKPHHARMMPYAFSQWRELEKITGSKLIENVGMLNIFINRQEDYDAIVQNYRSLNVRHEILSASEVTERFQGVNVEEGAEYVYEPEGGILRADKARLVLQNEITRLGGRIIDSCPVTSIEPKSNALVSIETTSGTFNAKYVIITCGPWANKVLKTTGITLPLTPTRVRVNYWRERIDYGLYTFDRFPATIKYIDSHIYSIPSLEYPGLMKVCDHTGVACDPDKRDENFAPEKEEELMRLLKKETSATFSNLQASPSVKETCIYTRSIDEDNIIDTHPNFPNIAIAAGFSGSGFKTAPAVARMLLDLVEGRPRSSDLEKMSMKRFLTAAKL